MADFTREVIEQIWSNHGDRIEVGPDRDGLDLIEIRHVDEGNMIGDSIVMPREQALLVAEALMRAVERAWA